jgi:hypothetical protein
MKIAIITSILGGYEATLKTPAKQTVDVDYYCFTDNPDIKHSGEWKIITEPYHFTHNEDDNFLNSYRTNKHTFMLAKYYKCHFNKIPILKEYDVIFWVDGTIKIIDEFCVEKCLELINKGHKIVTMDHDWRNGKMINEVIDSMTGCDYKANNRYNSKGWNNQWQPFQDVDAHYRRMVADGYTDDWWKPYNTIPRSQHYGIFVTCFICFDMREPSVVEFLEDWYSILKKESHQDQVAFSQALWKHKILPYGFPDNYKVSGNFNNNTLYNKLFHGL